MFLLKDFRKDGGISFDIFLGSFLLGVTNTSLFYVMIRRPPRHIATGVLAAGFFGAGGTYRFFSKGFSAQ